MDYKRSMYTWVRLKDVLVLSIEDTPNEYCLSGIVLPIIICQIKEFFSFTQILDTKKPANTVKTVRNCQGNYLYRFADN